MEDGRFDSRASQMNIIKRLSFLVNNKVLANMFSYDHNPAWWYYQSI